MIESLILILFGADVKTINYLEVSKGMEIFGAIITPLQIFIVVSSIIIFIGLFLFMKTLHIAIALCFVIFGTAACADKSTSECADTPRGDLDYAPDEELLSGKCLAERGRKILATDKIKAQGALSNLVTMYKWGEHQVAGEEGLGIVIKAHGCPTILPFVESMPKSSDSGYKLKWLHLMTLCGPGAKPVADIIKSLFDDPDKSVREQSFLLYTNLGLPLPLEYSSPTGITPQKEAEYKSAIDKAYEYATAVSTTGPEKAMTALENTIKNTPKYAAVAKLYLLLGRLKKEHQQNRDYAKSHPTEYTYFSIGDDYFYNGKQFTDLIARFSGNDLADDAGYELTKLSDWNDCEDDVGCGIESQLNPVLEFLKGFPDSEYSWKAVIRANEAFTSHE